MRSSRSRPACVSELFTSGLLSREKTTVEDGERLLAFCEHHDLELSADVREAYLIRIPKVPDPREAEDYRAQITVQDFRQTPATEEALYLMSISYDKLGLTDLKTDAERVLRQNFPDSKFLTDGLDRRESAWWKFW